MDIDFYALLHFLLPFLLLAWGCGAKVFASSSAGNWPPSIPKFFSTYGPSPPRQIFATGTPSSLVTIVNTHIQEQSPIAVNTVGREVYWYSASKQLLRSYFDSESVQVLYHHITIQPRFMVMWSYKSLVSPKLAALMSNLTVLALAYDWVGERVYFAARAGRSFSLWRVPLINPEGLENVFMGPSINEGSRVQLVMDPFSGYAYWTTQDGGRTVLYQQDLRAISGTIPTRSLDQSITNIQLQAMTLDPTNGRLWVSDAATGNILSCNATAWNCSVKVNATVLMNNSNAGIPATSIALDENYVYWTSQYTPGIFYTNISGSSALQIHVLSYGNTSAIFSTSPGQQPLPAVSCLSYDSATRPVLYQVSATNTSILIGWNVLSLSAVCQRSVFSFPTLTYVVNVLQYMGRLSQYPSPGVITLGTTFTLDRNLSAFMPYNVQVAAYNRYTVSIANFMYDSTTGVVANYGRFVDVMTSEGVPPGPQNLSASTSSTQAISVQWNPVRLEDIKGSAVVYYVELMGGQSALSRYANYTWRGLSPGRTYTISVIASNQVFNSTPAVVTAIAWPLPTTPVLLNKTNISVMVMVNVTSVLSIIRSYTVKISNGFRSSSASNPVKIFTLTGLKAYTTYSISIASTYISNEIQESQPLIVQTDIGLPDVPIITLSANFLLWKDVRSNDDRGIIGYRLFIDTAGGNTTNKFILINDIIREEEEMNAYDLEVLQLCAEQNETGIYYLTLFAQNNIGESNESNSIAYSYQSCMTQRIATQQNTIAIAAGASAAFIICSIALAGVGCVVLVFLRQKKAKQTHVHEDVDFNSVRFHSAIKVALNPQYTWTQDDYICSDAELQNLEYFPRENLKVESFIGRGEFGEVYQGTATNIQGVNAGTISVAIKTLQKEASPEEQKKFLSEAALMRNFNNPYVVKMLGVCIDTDQTCIIMELMPGGDLLRFLRDAKPDYGPTLLTLKELINIAMDVAKGCCILEQARFIHRDIAARNCLVSSKGADRVVKIGDFGLARDLYSSDYYQVEGKRRLPVRWMAPEALLQGKFSLESDVWSYGVLLWEIMTLGNQPYPGQTNQEVLHFISEGGRLDKPEGCPNKIYQMMQNCWNNSLSERPHFNDIVMDLNNFLDKNSFENTEEECSLSFESGTQLPRDTGTGIQMIGSPAQSNQTEDDAVEATDLPESYHV
eukprot:Em0023g731a